MSVCVAARCSVAYSRLPRHSTQSEAHRGPFSAFLAGEAPSVAVLGTPAAGGMRLLLPWLALLLAAAPARAAVLDLLGLLHQYEDEVLGRSPGVAAPQADLQQEQPGDVGGCRKS